MTRFLLWFEALGILALIALILYTPSTFAGDLVVTWTTQPGDQKPKEVAIFGDPAKGPDDPKAVKVLVDQASASTLVKESLIRESFPETTYLGITARNVGDTKWWTHADGTHTFIGWVPNASDIPPVVIDPCKTHIDNVKAILVGALDKCLAKPMISREKCLKGIRDALKKETK